MSIDGKAGTSRGNRRAQVYMSGMLATPVGAVKVTIRDISETGAHVIAERPVPVDSRVQLQRGSLNAYAHVAWASGKEAGLHFERTLSAHEVETALPSGLLGNSRA